MKKIKYLVTALSVAGLLLAIHTPEASAKGKHHTTKHKYKHHHHRKHHHKK